MNSFFLQVKISDLNHVTVLFRFLFDRVESNNYLKCRLRAVSLDGAKIMKTILEHYKRYIDNEKFKSENHKAEDKKRIKLNALSYQKQIVRQNKTKLKKNKIEREQQRRKNE